MPHQLILRKGNKIFNHQLFTFLLFTFLLSKHEKEAVKVKGYTDKYAHLKKKKRKKIIYDKLDNSFLIIRKKKNLDSLLF